LVSLAKARFHFLRHGLAKLSVTQANAIVPR